MVKDVNLTLMQTFYYVAKEGSFSGAARRLKISYQSAANHVRRLEQSLGYALVHAEQGLRNNLLTAEGKMLYQLLLPEFDTILARLNSVIDTGRPLIRVGLPQPYFYFLFPEIIAQFEQEYPESNVACFERDTGLVDMVSSGNLDVFIAERMFAERDVHQSLLGSYSLALIYPSSWPAPSEADLTGWADGRPFITYEDSHVIRNMALDGFSEGAREPRIFVSTSGSSSVMACVTSGLGFAVVPGWITRNLPPGTSRLMLREWPRLSVYFGEARFLKKNPYVTSLRELCRSSFTAAFADS